MKPQNLFKWSIFGVSLSSTSLLKMETTSNLNFLSTIPETLFQFGQGGDDEFESPGLLPMARKSPPEAPPKHCWGTVCHIWWDRRLQNENCSTRSEGNQISYSMTWRYSKAVLWNIESSLGNQIKLSFKTYCTPVHSYPLSATKPELTKLLHIFSIMLLFITEQYKGMQKESFSTNTEQGTLLD